MWIRNAWYVAAWSREVGRHLLARRLLDEPVVLYRRNDGTPVALLDRCAHKLAPLSMGRLVDDLPVRYVGFVVPDELYVGYGFDLEERYRELPDLHLLNLG